MLTPEHREWLAALPEGPIDVDDVVEICHGSPFDEDAYIFDELDAVRALKVSNAAALPVRPHALPRHLRAVRRRVRQRRVRSAPQMQVPMQRRLQVSGQSGIGRPAARRRSARRLRDRRHDAARVELYPAAVSGRSRRRRRSMKAGLPEVLAQRLAVGR